MDISIRRGQILMSKHIFYEYRDQLKRDWSAEVKGGQEQLQGEAGTSCATKEGTVQTTMRDDNRTGTPLEWLPTG